MIIINGFKVEASLCDGATILDTKNVSRVEDESLFELWY